MRTLPVVLGVALLATLVSTGSPEALAGKARKKRLPPSPAAAPASAAPADPGAPARPKVHRAWPLPALGRSTSGSPEVLFTFDDGPAGDITDSVLATLRKHGVRAIFFQVGERLLGSPKKRVAALEAEILADGHAIGSHTVNHKDLCRASNEAKIPAQLDENTRLLEDATGMKMVLFRAPYGVRCPALESALRERGQRHIHWDIDAEEWKTHDAVRTQAYIIKHIEALADGQRGVILIHDIHKETAAALPVILDWIDAENARRRAAGRREIKMLDPADVALEYLAKGMPDVLDGAGAEVAGFLPGLARALALPLGGKLAKL